MATDHWAAYTPDARAPWTLRRVVHLHRRAGFAGTWGELQRDLADGSDKAVDRLLGGAGEAPAGFDRTAGLLADGAEAAGDISRLAEAAGDISRLRAWWVYRMLLGPDPLGERLTLLWHDHFATAHAKVQDVGLMRRQNDTLRKHARGRLADLLNPSVREPALLLYLDAPVNRAGRPNENLARELMELFTLGVGHYSEADVKEAARCLTGWTVEDGRFAEDPARHDGGEKTVLGQTGRWTGTDLVNQLLRHPATAGRVARKVCRLFFGEGAIAPAAVDALAAGLRGRGLDVGWAVGTVLRSRAFFADANLGTRVLGPVEAVVGAVRALALFDPAPSTLALADLAGHMGQALFDPPNVGGGPDGRGWVSTRSMIARANFAAGLVRGSTVGRAVPYDPAALPKAHGFGTRPADMVTFHHRLLFGTDPPAATRARLAGVDGRTAVEMLLASPEAQLA